MPLTQLRSGNSTDVQCRFRSFSIFLLRSVLLICILRVLEVACTTGKTYIFTLPLMIHNDAKITCFLYALKNKQVEVYYTYKSKPAEVLPIPYRSMLQYQISDSDVEFIDQGPKAVYRFHSVDAFTVTVLMLDSNISIEVVQLLPVEAWSKVYFAVTLPRTPSIQIFTSDGVNFISVLLVTFFPHAFKFKYQEKTYFKDSTLKIELEKEQGFSLSDCQNKTDGVGSLSGTHISGTLPLGVISGSCYGATRALVCDTDKKHLQHTTRDIIADMLIPYAGVEIITPNIVGRLSPSDVHLIATANATVVDVSDDPAMYQVKLDAPGASKIIPQKYGPLLIKSNEPIHVYFVLLSACDRTMDKWELGDPALSRVPPILHFYDSYGWSVFDWNSFHIKHYASFIIGMNTKNNLLMDELPLPVRHTARGVHGTVEWVTLTVAVTPGLHYTYTTGINPFACFIYGLGPELAYMYSANQIIADQAPATIATTVQTTVWPFPDRLQPYDTTKGMRTTLEACVKTEPLTGDELDNDCDGRIDEEKVDNLDNDADGRYDEDVQFYPHKKRDGGWGEWSPWRCPDICSNTDMYRIRLCDRPQPTEYGLKCDGRDKETNTDKCYFGDTCPYDCSDYTFGASCAGRCPNCVDPCNKMNGTCSHCQPGWTDPEKGCNRECPPYSFGENCRGDCKKKCKNSECIEKRFGQCKQCAPFTWGVECKKSCENCVKECSKNNGSCKACKAGYKGAQHGCVLPCGPGEYGENCANSCDQKCGEDCVDRVTGQCAASDALFYVFVIAISILPVFVVYLYRVFGKHGKKKSDPESGPQSLPREEKAEAEKAEAETEKPSEIKSGSTPKTQSDTSV